jgi:hypothetical protein
MLRQELSRLHSTKDSRIGATSSVICCLCFSKAGRAKLLLKASKKILSTCTFDKTIANLVTEIVYLDIDMSRSITISRIGS